MMDNLTQLDNSEESLEPMYSFLADGIAAAASIAPSKRTVRKSDKLPGWGTLLEICTSPTSQLGETAAAEYPSTKVIRITESMNFESAETVEQLAWHIVNNPGISLHGSLPCTVWSSWQNMSVHKHGQKYAKKLKQRRKKAAAMLRSFIALADLALDYGGEISFEWPRHCLGWLRPEMLRFIERYDLFSVAVDGCAVGMQNSAGEPLLKQWRFITSSP